MRILVTGGCGFLGSHVCEVFKDHGWDVLAYDDLTKFEYSRVPYFDIDKVRMYNLEMLESIGVPTIIADVRNSRTLRKAAGGCDLIAHCAAQPAMTIAIENPERDFEINAHGTLEVLEVCRDKSIPMVNCSTIHVYGNGLNDYLTPKEGRFSLDMDKGIDEREDILTGNITPLHASKRSAEIYVQSYIDTYGVQAANFRLTGIYGPRQFGGEDHGWVANFAIRTVLDLPIKIFGTDKQVRDILYVKDAAMAFLTWYEAGCPTGTYNIGGGEPCITSLGNCLNILHHITGKKQDISKEPPRHGDLYYFCCDTRKATSTFGWSAFTLPQVGINELVKWIQDNKEVFK